MIDLEQYIGHGKEKAVTRGWLMTQTGLSDREIRKAISEARGSGSVILNDQDGLGYYFPTIEEYESAVKCLEQEEKRAKCVMWTLKALQKWVYQNEQKHKAIEVKEMEQNEIFKIYES